KPPPGRYVRDATQARDRVSRRAGARPAGRDQAERSASASKNPVAQPTTSMALANFGRTGTTGAAPWDARRTPNTQTRKAAAKRPRPTPVTGLWPNIHPAGRSKRAK